MTTPEESSISLAPHIKISIKLLKLSGCFWNWSAWKKCTTEKFRNTLFKVYFTTVLLYLMGCIIFLMTHITNKDLRSRQLTLTGAILNTNLQIFVLFIKRDEFSRLVEEVPIFSNKKAIEIQLKHALRIVRPWSIFKIIFYAIFAAFLLYSVLGTTFIIPRDSFSFQNLELDNVLGVSLIFEITFRCTRFFSLLSMSFFQFGTSMLIMTLLTFINGYLNHLKCCIRRLKIRDPLQINVGWISNYDEEDKYDMQYCVSLHQFIIR